MGYSDPSDYDILESRRQAADAVNLSDHGGNGSHASIGAAAAGSEQIETLDRNGNGHRSVERRGSDASGNAGSTSMTQPVPPSAVPTADGHELDSFLGRAYEEKP